MLVKLEKFVELKQGLAINAQTNYLISNHQTSEFQYPLLKIVDMENKNFSTFVSTNVNDNVIAKQDDIIYTRTGQIGLAFRGFEGVVHNNSFIVSLISNEIDKDFLFVILNSDFVRKQALKMAKNSVQPDLTHAMFKSIQIPFYEKSIQKKIAKIILELDLQLERNNNMVKRLQVLSHTIFNRFFASESSLVPLVEFPYIQILKPGIQKFEGIKHYIATAEVEGEKINYDAPLIEYATRENRANMQPIPNSIWFAKMKRSIKHIYVTSNDNHLIDNYVFSTGFCGIKCDDVAFEYMVNYLNLPYFEKEKDILSHGATMEGVNNEDLKSFKIHLPAKETLLLFSNTTRNIHYEIAKINKMTHQLTLLKNRLLPLLISGQLQ
ncbi:restriction endonuclease subunit S [bacterium]|nr:restriction endonuclease subunit S [bacterium]